MDREELIKKIQGRVDKARWLARTTTDEKTRVSLLAMADEGAADIARLLAENNETLEPDKGEQ